MPFFFAYSDFDRLEPRGECSCYRQWGLASSDMYVVSSFVLQLFLNVSFFHYREL